MKWGIWTARRALLHIAAMCPHQMPCSLNHSSDSAKRLANAGLSHRSPLAIPAVVTDFTAADYQERLYERYAEWQRDTPVFRNQEGVVYLTRYEDCARLLSDERFGRQADHGSPNSLVPKPQKAGALHATMANWMIFMDAPRHPIVRRAFSQVLSARVALLTDATMRVMARGLIAESLGGHAVDFLSGLAGRLPALVICHLMGVPAGDSAELGPWAFQAASALDSGEEEGMRNAAPAANALREYFSRFVVAEAARGTGGFVGDLRETNAGPELSEEEVIDGCLFLLVAGLETTRNMIANSVLALAQNLAELQRLRAKPALLKTAIEELLRFTGPLQKLSRWTREDVTLGGYAIPRGTLVVALVGAANRDPSCFADPHRLDLRRSLNPPHLAFGRGGHACIGRPLAVREASIALEELLRATRTIELIEHRWSPNASMRSLDSLILHLQPPSGVTS